MVQWDAGVSIVSPKQNRSLAGWRIPQAYQSFARLLTGTWPLSFFFFPKWHLLKNRCSVPLLVSKGIYHWKDAYMYIYIHIYIYIYIYIYICFSCVFFSQGTKTCKHPEAHFGPGERPELLCGFFGSPTPAESRRTRLTMFLSFFWAAGKRRLDRRIGGGAGRWGFCGLGGGGG